MEATALRDEVRAAEEEIAGGHPDQALGRCQQLQIRYPRALVIQRVIGEAYLALRKPREALAALERCLAGDPEDVRACCARAVVHEIHGDSVAALAWYRRACEIRPDDTGLRDIYRDVATRLGQPAYRPSAVGLARLYLRGDLFQHAQLEWSGLVTQYPDRLDLQAGLAETYWRAGDLRRASDLARRIVANTPSCLKAILIVAALEHANGRDDEAERHLQRASELDPERRMGRVLYGDLIASGDAMIEILLMGKPRPLAIPSAAQADLQAVQELAQSRSSAIPDDFHQIFAETEFMLWGREQDDTMMAEPAHTPPGTAAPPIGGVAPASTPLGPMGRPAVAASSPFGNSATTDMNARPDRLDYAARPATGGLSAVEDGGLDDTDSRQATGWVRWLQAQGARSLDRSGRRLSASNPLAGSAIDAFPMTAAASGGLPMSGSASGGLPMLGSASGVLPMSGGASGGLSTLGAPGAGLPMSASPSGRLPLSGAFSGGPPMSAAPMSAPPSGGLPMSAPTSGGLRPGGFGGGALPDAISVPGPASGDPPMSSGASDGLSWSGSMSEHSPEDLRDMFAQLAPAAPRAGDPPPTAADLPAFLAPPPADHTNGFAAVLGDGATPAGDESPFMASPADLPAPEPASANTSANASRWGFEDTDGDHGGLGPVALGPGAPGDLSTAGRDGYGPAHYDQPPSPTSFGVAAQTAADAATAGDGDYAAQLASARAHSATGALPDALEDYRAILRGSSDYLGDIVGDLQSLAASTDSADVHRLLGDARIRQGDYVGALESYNRAQALTQAPGA
jgi:tetratricopeptide (TPR) repeat protein